MLNDPRDSEIEPDRTNGEPSADDRKYGAARQGERLEGESALQRDLREPDSGDRFGADDLDESLATRRQEERGDVF